MNVAYFTRRAVICCLFILSPSCSELSHHSPRIAPPKKKHLKPEQPVPRNKKAAMIYNLNFNISVTPDNNRLDATITNNGAHAVNFSLTAFDILMKFTVIGEQGNAVSLTQLGLDLAENDIDITPTSRPSILAPGGSESHSFEISKLFLSVPGKTYSISAEWSVWVFESFDKQLKWLVMSDAGVLLPLTSNMVTFLAK